VAVGALVAPPVNVSLLGQREKVTVAGGHGNEPPSQFRQGFDPPGQHLARGRAVAELAVPVAPKGKDRAGVGHRQGEARAEGDAHHAIIRERVDPLRSELALRLWIELIAQTGRLFIPRDTTPGEEASAIVHRRARIYASGHALKPRQRLDLSRPGARAPVGVAESDV